MVRGQVKPIRDNVLISDMEFDVRVTASGIILQNDDGKTEGIRPRWGRVYAIGPEQKNVKLGEWILVEHGRWTRGVEVENDDGTITTIRRVDNDCILALSDEKPSEF